jgi:cytochrome c biogenesis protein
VSALQPSATRSRRAEGAGGADHGQAGAANKWGYIFAHSAIVIICVGGCSIPTCRSASRNGYGKTPFAGNGVIAEMPAQHRLGLATRLSAATRFIPEGGSSSYRRACRAQNGVLIQDLPFTIKLKKLHHRFLFDRHAQAVRQRSACDRSRNRQEFPATIKVNEPLIYKGLAVYQSSFEDGGSKLKVAGYPMKGERNGQLSAGSGEVSGTIRQLGQAGRRIHYRVVRLRPFNVENMAPTAICARWPKANPGRKLDSSLGSAGQDGGQYQGFEECRPQPAVQAARQDRPGSGIQQLHAAGAG